MMESQATGSPYLNAASQFMISASDAQGWFEKLDSESQQREATNQLAKVTKDLRDQINMSDALLARQVGEIQLEEIEDVYSNLRNSLAERPDRVIDPSRSGMEPKLTDFDKLRVEAEAKFSELDAHRAAVIIATAERDFSEGLAEGDFERAMAAVEVIHSPENLATANRGTRLVEAVKAFIEKKIDESIAQGTIEAKRLVSTDTNAILNRLISHPAMALFDDATIANLRTERAKAIDQLEGIVRGSIYNVLREVWSQWHPGAANTGAVADLLNLGNTRFPAEVRAEVEAVRAYFERNRIESNYLVSIVDTTMGSICSGFNFSRSATLGGQSIVGQSNLRLSAVDGTSYEFFIEETRPWWFLYFGDCTREYLTQATRSVEQMYGRHTYASFDETFRYVIEVKLEEPKPDLPALLGTDQ
jgi:hypothetical protein